MDLDDLLHDEPDPPPLYVEICQHYVNQIDTGRIKPDTPLPAIGDVAEEFGVSRSTAGKGLALLASTGWARHVPGHPYQALRPEKTR
ncbi:MAG: winged helix-turn-helix domain-containing protein [Trebonia sp.]